MSGGVFRILSPGAWGAVPTQDSVLCLRPLSVPALAGRRPECVTDFPVGWAALGRQDVLTEPRKDAARVAFGPPRLPVGIRTRCLASPSPLGIYKVGSVTQARSAAGVALPPAPLPSMDREGEKAPGRDLCPGKGGLVTSNDEPRGQSWFSFLCPLRRQGTLLRGLWSQAPSLLLETEANCSPSYCGSSGSCIRELGRPVWATGGHGGERVGQGRRGRGAAECPDAGSPGICTCHPR